MPPAVAYVEDQNSTEARVLEQAFNRELERRRQDIDKVWKYYDGKHNKPLKPDGSSVDDNLIVNLVELIVDKGVSGLIGASNQGATQGVRFEIIDQPGEPGFNKVIRAVKTAITRKKSVSPSQKYLDAVWDANERDLFILDLLTTGSLAGHLFIKVLEAGAGYNEEYPRLVIQDPRIVGAFWQADDIDKVLWFRIQFGQQGSRVRQDIVRHEIPNFVDPNAEMIFLQLMLFPELTGSFSPVDIENYDVDGTKTVWVIYNYREVPGQAGWTRSTSKEVWNYSWPPIIHWKNLPLPHRFYGKNDIGITGSLNDGLNFILSNMARILKHHAHPKTIGTGMKAEDVTQSDIDRFWTTGNEKAKVYNLEMQSDLQASLSVAQFLRRAIFDSSRELDPSTVQDKLGDLTNFALRVLYGDSLGKGGVKRLLYGHGFRILNWVLLELGGFDPKENVVATMWPDPLPSDPLQMAQALAIDTQHGLSNETYLEERGFDPDQEGQRMASQPQPTVNPLNPTSPLKGNPVQPDTSETNSRGKRPNPLKK